MVQEITNLIANLGFPIAMVFYFIWDKTKSQDKLSEAVNNNTTVITKLLALLPGLGNEEKLLSMKEDKEEK